LKLTEAINEAPVKTVALFTGAWIEMKNITVDLEKAIVALFTGAWIEIKQRQKRQLKSRRRALYGRVD